MQTLSGKRWALAAALWVGGWLLMPAAHAKPMLAPTLERMMAEAEGVVVGTYQKSVEKHSVSYFSGVTALYRVEDVLWGKLPLVKNQVIAVRYAFHDGSACLPPEKWEFNPRQILPGEGSRWILLLKKPAPKASDPNRYETIRGDAGRLPATKETLQQVKGLLR